MGTSTTPTTITVTGAGGQIGYALLFRIAAGGMLGADRPVRLRLLEVPQGLSAAEGTALELLDGAFPLLAGVESTADAASAFDGAELAILVGARPRTAGMERRDLLEANAGIFGPQGRAIQEHADDDVRVLVVGNPANTNALITRANAPDLPDDRFTALTRLDHNRALAQLSATLDTNPGRIRDVAIWGNHSSSQFPDVSRATADGDPVLGLLHTRFGADGTTEWLVDEFIPRVADRGAEIIAARGASSAASAASAIVDHVRDWMLGRPAEAGSTSAGVVSDGSYGVPAGLVSSFPVSAPGGGRFEIVPGLELDAFARDRIAASVAELEAERDAVRGLGLI